MRSPSEVTGGEPHSAGDAGQCVSCRPVAKVAYNSIPGYIHIFQRLRLLSAMKRSQSNDDLSSFLAPSSHLRECAQLTKPSLSALNTEAAQIPKRPNGG